MKSLKRFMQQLRHTASGLRKQKHIFMPLNLMKCTHVLIRYDAVRASLRHKRPFLVIDKADKFLKIQKDGNRLSCHSAD